MGFLPIFHCLGCIAATACSQADLALGSEASLNGQRSVELLFAVEEVV